MSRNERNWWLAVGLIFFAGNAVFAVLNAVAIIVWFCGSTAMGSSTPYGNMSTLVANTLLAYLIWKILDTCMDDRGES